MGMLKDHSKRLERKRKTEKRKMMGQIGLSEVPLVSTIFPNFDFLWDLYVKCNLL